MRTCIKLGKAATLGFWGLVAFTMVRPLEAPLGPLLIIAAPLIADHGRGPGWSRMVADRRGLGSASSAAAEKAPLKLAQPKLVQNSTWRSGRRRVTRPASDGDSTLADAAAKLACSDEIPFLCETAL